jgi:hypothetical protein
VITRNIDPAKYQGKNPPAFYQDTLEVRQGQRTPLKISAQASASAKGPRAFGVSVENIAEGKHTGTLESQSAGAKLFKNIIRIDGSEILIHPDAPNNQENASEWHSPCSAGCTVPKLTDFNAFVSTLERFGKEYRPRDEGNLDSIPVTYKRNY